MATVKIYLKEIDGTDNTLIVEQDTPAQALQSLIDMLNADCVDTENCNLVLKLPKPKLGEYIVYDRETLKIVDSFVCWGKRIMNLLDKHSTYAWINTTHPAHQDILTSLTAKNQ